MSDSELNQLATAAPDPARPGRAGDVPERLRRRYLTEMRRGAGLGFYADARAPTPVFRDRGRRLTTDRNDPQVVRDLVAIARHRGWTGVEVRGETEFRREVWIVARAAGLEVRGYQATARDLQDLARRVERRRGPEAGPHPHPRTTPLEVVEAVVRSRIVEADRQARVIAAARARIAAWLERGARFDGPPEPRRPRTVEGRPR